VFKAPFLFLSHSQSNPKMILKLHLFALAAMAQALPTNTPSNEEVPREETTLDYLNLDMRERIFLHVKNEISSWDIFPDSPDGNDEGPMYHYNGLYYPVDRIIDELIGVVLREIERIDRNMPDGREDVVEALGSRDWWVEHLRAMKCFKGVLNELYMGNTKHACAA
jgi:hypothetical protein